MRRTSIALALALFAGMVGTPASAGANIAVENEEEAGEKLSVFAFECESGEGFEAFIEVNLLHRRTQKVIADKTRSSEGSPTKVKVRIPGSTEPGRRYIARVRCLHRFTDGSEGVFYVSEEFFRVT